MPGCGHRPRARALCRDHALPVEAVRASWSPWAHEHECPGCGSPSLTMPYDPTDPATAWHCCVCGHWWTPRR